MSKKVVVLNKRIITLSILVIGITIFIFRKYSNLSSEINDLKYKNEELLLSNEELLIENEELKSFKMAKISEDLALQEEYLNQQEKLLNEQKTMLLRQDAIQVNLDTKQKEADKVSEYLLKNIQNCYSARIDIHSKVLFLDDIRIPLNNSYAYYEYNTKQPKYGYHYLTIDCLDDTSCISQNGSKAVGYSFPVASKTIAEKMSVDLNTL